MPVRRLVLFLLGLTALPAAFAQTAPRRYAVLVGGLGGSPEHTATFRQYLFDTHRALTETLGFPAEDVTVLAERAAADLPVVDDVALAENIRARLAALAERVTSEDAVYVILFGHGSYDGTHAYLNIPRRDLSEADYAALLAPFRARSVVFVNTAGASGPFVEALSAPGRIVITATRTGTQRNATVFPRYFVAALTDPAADGDRDGALSVREVFAYAAAHTARFYESAGHLATEQALLEDTGDGQGFRAGELAEAAEGNLAGVIYLRRPPLVAGGDALQLREKEQLERDIAALKSRKAALSEDAYYAELESLFVRLARLNDLLEARKN